MDVDQHHITGFVTYEIKLGKFNHEYKSQLELYLRWLNKHERQQGENTPLGLLLCAEKSDEIIELLELDKSGIHVATYLTELPPMEWLRQNCLNQLMTLETACKIKRKNN